MGQRTNGTTRIWVKHEGVWQVELRIEKYHKKEAASNDETASFLIDRKSFIRFLETLLTSSFYYILLNASTIFISTRLITFS